jgi:hypothetical protein
MKVGDTVTLVKGHNSVKGRPGKITAISGSKATVQIGGRSVDAPLTSLQAVGSTTPTTGSTKPVIPVSLTGSPKPSLAPRTGVPIDRQPPRKPVIPISTAPAAPTKPAAPAAPAARSYGGYSIGDTVTIYGQPYTTTVVTGKVVDFTKYGSMTYVQVKSDTDGKIWSADPNDKDSIRKGAPDKSLHRFEVQVGEVEHSGDEEDAVRQIKKIPGARIVSTQRPYADEYGQEMVIFTVEGPYTAKEFYAKARELGIDL